MQSPNELPEELQKYYRESIPGKMMELEKRIKDFQTSQSKEDLEALRVFIHQLAGSAGSYGYSEVSQLCKEWDSRLQKKKMEELDSLLEEIQKRFHYGKQ